MFSLGVLLSFSIWLMPLAVRGVAQQWNSENVNDKINALTLLFGDCYLLAYVLVQLLQKLF